MQRRNANADADGNRDTDTNIYAVRNSDTQTYAITQTSPDAAASPDTPRLRGLARINTKVMKSLKLISKNNQL